MTAKAEEAAPSYRWVILALSSMYMMAGTFLGISLGLLLPAILEEIAMTPVQQGWLSASQRIGAAVLSIPVAWWIARYNPRTVRSIASLAGGVMVLLQAVAPGYAVLLLGRTGYGLASLVNQPSGTLLIRQWFANREIALVNGITIFVIGVTEFSTAAFTPYLVAFLGGWRPTLAVACGWTFLSALAWLWFGRERVTPEYRAGIAGAERPPMWAVLQRRELWLVCGGALGGPAVWWAFGTFWPRFMHESTGLPLTTLGFVFGLTSLGMAPAGLFFGYLASRFGIGRWILVACGLLQAVFSLVMLATDSVPVLVVAGSLVGISWGFTPLVSTIPYHLPRITPREVAVAVAFVSSMFALGGTLGPIIAGMLLEVTGSTVLALGIMCLCPLSISAIGFAYPDQRRTSTVAAEEA